MQSEIVAHRKAVVQALTVARLNAERLATLNPAEDRLPFEIQCLATEVSEGLPSLVEGHDAYEQAQAAFDSQPSPSYRPDSLSRRGDILIARRKLPHWANPDNTIAEWKSLLSELFDGQVVIYDASVDRKSQLRVHFSLTQNGAPSAERSAS